MLCPTVGMPAAPSSSFGSGFTHSSALSSRYPGPCLPSADRENAMTYLCIYWTVQLSPVSPSVGAFSVPSLLGHTQLGLPAWQILETGLQKKVSAGNTVHL